MRRRNLIAGLLSTATVGQARAQQSAKRYRIAILEPASPVEVMNESVGPEWPLWGPLFKELRRLGYVEGQNLTVERYSGRGNYSPDLVRKVVASNPNLIFALGFPVLRDLVAATQTIPIVGIIGTVGQTSDVITNLAHPGGNITGVGIASGPTGFETHGKRLALLREMVPKMSRVGYLTVREVYESLGKPYVEKLAKELGITVVGPFLEKPVTEAEIRRVLAAMSEERVDALYVNDPPEVWVHTPLVIRLAQEFRLPAIYAYRYWVQIGGLMGYDYGLSELGRILADQIDQVLKGTKPGDIPVYRLDNYKLSINLKTAKALGLTIPTSLLASADEVIE